MMEIGAVNIFSSSSSSQKAGNFKNVTGFKGLVGTFLQEPNLADDSAAAANKLLQSFSKEELLDLIAFLQTEDVLDLDEGLLMLNQSLSVHHEDELFQLIEEVLLPNLSLAQLAERIDVASLGTNAMRIEDLVAVLGQLNAMTSEELRNSLSGDMAQILKTVKMFELLAGEQKLSADHGKLKDLLQQFTKRLELLLSADSENKPPLNRQEYIIRTFSAVAQELNSKQPLAKQTGEAGLESKNLAAKAETVHGMIQYHQVSKAEQLTLSLQQGERPTGANELIKQFENILARSNFSNNAGTQKLLIKLNPEHLGALRIELIQRDAGLVAKIMTTTKLAKETLETHLNGLKQAFGTQNIQVDRVEISQALNQQQERFIGREQQSQQNGQENRQQQEQGKNETEEASFMTSFEEALLNTEV